MIFLSLFFVSLTTYAGLPLVYIVDSFPCISLRDCKFSIEHESMHGMRVFNYLEKDLKDKFQLVKVNLYNEKGSQDKKLVEQLMKDLSKSSPQLVIMAMGILTENLPSSFSEKFPKTLFLLASGTKGKGISEKTKLWPQNFALPQMVMGTYYFPSLYPSPKKGQRDEVTGYLPGDIINLELVDYLFPQKTEDKSLSGSSLAVTKLAQEVISRCSDFIYSKNRLKACLDLKSKPFSDMKSSTSHSKKFMAFP